MCRVKKERGQGQYHVGRRNDVFILQKVPQKDELMTSSFYEKMTHTESVDVTPTTLNRVKLDGQIVTRVYESSVVK